MMVVVLFIIAYFFVLIWPVRFAARAVGARRDSIFICFVAVVIVAMVNNGLSSLDLGGDTLTMVGAFVAYFVVSGAIFMLVLDSSFLGGVAIAFVQTVLSMILLLVFTIVLSAVFPDLELALH